MFWRRPSTNPTILTFNVKHFAKATLQPWGISAIKPGDYLATIYPTFDPESRGDKSKRDGTRCEPQCGIDASKAIMVGSEFHGTRCTGFKHSYSLCGSK